MFRFFPGAPRHGSRISPDPFTEVTYEISISFAAQWARSRS
jgi:hypothetical protein